MDKREKLDVFKARDAPKGEKCGLGIAVPASDTLPTAWALHFMNLQKQLPSGMRVDIRFAVGPDICQNRNELVDDMKDHCKYLLFVDTDVFLPLDAVPRWFAELEQTNKKLITGFYWLKREPPEPVVYKKIGHGAWFSIKPGGYKRVDAAGLGCTIIDTSIFDELEKPYFRWNWRKDDVFHGEKSEDIHFFLNAKEAGYPLWCDTCSPCLHIDQKSGRFYPNNRHYADYMEKVRKWIRTR